MSRITIRYRLVTLLIFWAVFAVAVWLLKLVWLDEPTYAIYIRVPGTVVIATPCPIMSYGTAYGRAQSVETLASGESLVTAEIYQSIPILRGSPFIYVPESTSSAAFFAVDYPAVDYPGGAPSGPSENRRRPMDVVTASVARQADVPTLVRHHHATD
jgi:hypothetical protein